LTLRPVIKNINILLLRLLKKKKLEAEFNKKMKRVLKFFSQKEFKKKNCLI